MYTYFQLLKIIIIDFIPEVCNFTSVSPSRAECVNFFSEFVRSFPNKVEYTTGWVTRETVCPKSGE